jgi:hypothetical protein
LLLAKVLWWAPSQGQLHFDIFEKQRENEIELAKGGTAASFGLCVKKKKVFTVYSNIICRSFDNTRERLFA